MQGFARVRRFRPPSIRLSLQITTCVQFRLPRIITRSLPNSSRPLHPRSVCLPSARALPNGFGAAQYIGVFGGRQALASDAQQIVEATVPVQRARSLQASLLIHLDIQCGCCSPAPPRL